MTRQAPMTQDERSKMETAWADRRCDTVQRDGFVDGWTAAYAEVADLKRRQIDAPLRRQPIPEPVAAAAKAVRHELNEVEALTEYSERGAAEICESVARAALAVLPEGSVDARKWAQAQLDIDTAHRERDSAWLAVETNCTDDYLISRLHQEMAKANHHHEQEGILAERCEAAADRAEKAEKEREANTYWTPSGSRACRTCKHATNEEKESWA